jgi:hypothetical protein
MSHTSNQSSLEGVRRSQVSAGVARSPLPIAGGDGRPDEPSHTMRMRTRGPSLSHPASGTGAGPRCPLVKVEAGSSGGPRACPGHPGATPAPVLADGPLVYTEDHEPNSPEQGTRTPLSKLKWRLQETARGLLPEFKGLQKCHRTPHGRVEVHRSQIRQSAAYRGLCTCRGIASCAVCSGRIAAHRASELTDGIERYRALGGTVILVTTTASHTREDRLEDLLERRQQARQRFYRNGTVRRFLESIGYDGRVSALEITFGLATGYHPHDHAAFFVRADTDPHDVQLVLGPAWVEACRRVGLVASLHHGLDVRGGEAAGAYVSKLGLEVALAVRKLGRGDRHGIWQLLHRSASDPWAALAFQTIARTLRKRRQRHLIWSDGLRDYLGLGVELSDEEVMQAKGELDEQMFAWLTHKLWKGVCSNDLRGELLQAAGTGDTQSAVDLLAAFGLDISGLHFD